MEQSEKKRQTKYYRTTGKSKGKQGEVQDLIQSPRPWKALLICVRTVLPSNVWMGLIHVFKYSKIVMVNR